MTDEVPIQLPGSADVAVYVNGTVYILANYDKIYAINVAENSSKLLLSIVSNDVVIFSYNDMVYADGELVLVGNSPTPVYLINPKNGEGFGIGVNVEDPAVLYDPVTGYVYVTDEYSNALYVVNPSTGKVVNMIPSIWYPSALAYNPKNGYLYVAGYYNNSVAEVNPYSGQVIWSVVAGKNPNAVLYNTYNNLLYVEYSGTSTVAIINASTGEILGEAQVGSDPVSLTFDPSTGLVYVANQDSDSVSVINGTQVVNTINLNFNPTTLAFINGSLYIGGINGNSFSYLSPHIAVYRGGKIVANISLNAWPTAIQYYNGLVYVTEYTFPAYLAVINGTRVLTYVKVGENPTSITVTPNGTIYVANKDEGTINEISVSVKPIATTTATTSTTLATSTATTSTTPTTTTMTTATTIQTGVSSSSAPPTTSTSGLSISSGLLIAIVVVVIVIVVAVVFLLKR